MELLPEGRMPKREEIEKEILQHAKDNGLNIEEMKVDFGTMEEVLIFGLAGGVLHNLDFIDDPIFVEAANSTLGTEFEDGEPVPEEEIVCSKIPVTMSGYALLNKDGHIVGFAFLESHLKRG